jgi:HAMP domain-containing protein
MHTAGSPLHFIIVGVAVVAIIAFFATRWLSNRKS